ncbi:mechanosensitive ion channel family protein [Micrococcoides hystricis]|uniref:Mechanosensitive ion channel domain-containing protein n=1 Tax=Micrococcoides hystricis TaxID=1572761 RepID=A0ABV6PCR5_9MICC
MFDTFLSVQPEPTPSDLGEVTEKVTEEVGRTVYTAGPLFGTLLSVGISILVAIVVTVLLALILRQVFRRSPKTLAAAKKMRTPLFLAVLFMTGKITLNQIPIEGFTLMSLVQWILLFAGLGCIAWLLINAVKTAETAMLTKYEGASVTDRRARKIQTQTVLIRRILIVAIVVIVLSIGLLTIPAVRAVGAGLIASAGILSVIAGLAVQSSLANIFAGLQIVFTDAIRVGDVVQVEEYFGTVEDITLTYVVVKIWDERRVIYPSTFFTTNPFENFTRTGSSASGTVEFEVDWSVPVDAMRARLSQLVESTDLWDGRDRSIQVTEALGGMIKVRIVVSAANTGNLWDLRALVREDMINFLRAEHPESIYRQRFTAEELPMASGTEADEDSETDSAKAGSAKANNAEQPKDREEPAARPVDQSSSRVEPLEPAPRLQTLDDIFAEGSVARGSLPKIQPQTGGAVPLQEAESDEEEETSTSTTPLTVQSADSAMFTGSITALERGLDYMGPGDDVYKERQERQERSYDDQDEPDEDAPEDAVPDQDEPMQADTAGAFAGEMTDAQADEIEKQEQRRVE